MIKVYLGGCSGIVDPKDMDGEIIKVGDSLSWNYGDESEPALWMYKAAFKVENHRSGKGLCGKGIHKELYLHDFLFEHTKIIK